MVVVQLLFVDGCGSVVVRCAVWYAVVVGRPPRGVPLLPVGRLVVNGSSRWYVVACVRVDRLHCGLLVFGC